MDETQKDTMCEVCHEYKGESELDGILLCKYCDLEYRKMTGRIVREIYPYG